LIQGIRQGKMGRWLTLTGFAKVDDLGEDATVPDWMLSKTEKDKVRETTVTSGDIQLRGGIQPDIVILEGWPETDRACSHRAAQRKHGRREWAKICSKTYSSGVGIYIRHVLYFWIQFLENEINTDPS